MMHSNPFVVVMAACLLCAPHLTAPSLAQTIQSVHPRTVQPGQATQLTVHGAELNDTLKVVASSSAVAVQIDRIEPTQAVITVTVPPEMPFGPLGLLIGGTNGPLKQLTLMHDDLPAVADNGTNHTRETAQAVETLNAIEGFCDGALSDFYRFTVTAGERVAFEVQSQPLQSSMDAVLRLLTADGKTLHLSDDGGVGPDCRFAHRFEAAGEYWIEVLDSRHAAAGAPYQLRIGDFPIVTTAFPLAAQVGQTTAIGFAGADGAAVSGRELMPRADSVNYENVAAKLAEGRSSSWTRIAISPFPQHTEAIVADPPLTPTASQPLTIPVGISGRLQTPQEVDSYALLGTKDQAVRCVARTHSLASPTLLQMQLFNPAGVKLAETAVTAASEWSFDFTFPEDGNYRLAVNDLLKRGGDDFSYWIEISTVGTFHVTLKPEAAVRDEFALELAHGACPIDLTITRFGYDGELEVALAEPVAGLRLVNARVPAGAAEARIYLAADEQWTAEQLKAIRLVASPIGQPDNKRWIDSRSLQRVRLPTLMLPPLWNNGQLLIGAASPTATPFALEPTSNPVQFARPLGTHNATLTLKRLQAEFTGAVNLVGPELPAGWNFTQAADKETYTATFTGTTAEAAPASLKLQAYGELNGRGRLTPLDVPVQWIDPVQVSLQFPQPLVVGGAASLRAMLTRQGNDPQPVTLTFPNPPAGLTLPESVTIAADQTQADFSVHIAPAIEVGVLLQVTAASKYTGQDFSVLSAPTSLPLIAGPTELTVFPPEIVLDNQRSQQQVVVTGTDSQLAPRDWTRLAHWTIANPAVAELQGQVVVPKSDGETELSVTVGSLTQSIPVRVTGAGTRRPVAFEAEALVALSKQGCNSGACHGSPSGKGGFRLSLRAFDMQLDELTLLREEAGRRVNLLDPAQSLLLLKPLMKVPHGGAKQLHPDDAAYRVLLDWIADGAHTDPPNTPRIERLEVFPHSKQVLAVADGGQQLVVTAHFADGSRRDVTDLVAYETSDTSVATVDVHGLVTPHSRGEIAILVRFLEHIESLPLMFVEESAGFAWQAPPANNYVDELVNAKLRQLQYLPSETCSDSEFIRRSSLDVLGLLPTVEETQRFLADTSPNKRERWVDALLEREEYPKFWALKWGDLLRMTGKLVGDEGVYKYHRWLEESLRSNMPYDQFAKELLTGAGSTLANPPANFYRTATDMNECVETISQVFLGARLQCAKCHNHPFERWTQDNYYGLGAFFNRVERRTTERPGEMFVYTKFSGDVTQPRTGKVMAPWLPQVGSIEAKNDEDRRHAFANWLVEPSNPYFARIEANRIWSQLFSRGIVDPIDDFRDSNPPSNAPLLDALAKDFVESGYDRKHLLRTIMASRTYQASYQTNDFNREDVTYCSHQEPRLLSAEQLLDAINQTLNLQQAFGSLPAGTKATQLPAPDLVKVDFLKTFGQPERSTVCACERADDSNLGMAIELFNGPMIHEKLRSENNRFRQALAAGKSVTEAVQELYLAALCRLPSDIELKAALDHCAQVPEPAAALEDVCWALFNTDEFLFQH